MTKLLKKAIERASALPDDEQDALARLADEARKEIARGRTDPFDPATKPE